MSETQLQQVEQALSRYKFRKKRIRPLLKRSAVAIILQEIEAEVRILMIKRAESDGDAWSGQMAFPGGHMDPGDRHGFAVAVRETQEEIGLALGAGEPCIGRLSEIMTRPMLMRRRMVVSPYVFRLNRGVEFTPNREVAEVVPVPLNFLLDRGNRERMTWPHRGVEMPLPCYRYEGRCIWGMSLMMLDELLGLLKL